MTKKRRSREFWRELVERYEAEPTQTHRQFARDNDVATSTFQSWLYLFRKEIAEVEHTDDNQPHSFIDVTPPLPLPPLKSAQATLFLPNQISLEFTTLPDPHYLASFMAVLRGD